jgi:hypothetical protein
VTEQSAPSFKLSGWLSIRINTVEFATSIYISPLISWGIEMTLIIAHIRQASLKIPAAKKSVYEIETELERVDHELAQAQQKYQSFIVISNGGTGRTAGARE